MTAPVRVTLDGLFQDGRSFKGVVRTRLSRNAEADCKFVAPYTWDETPFGEDGTAVMTLLPNEALGEDTFYEYQIVRHDVFGAKVIQKGSIVVPPEDCLMNDLITVPPSVLPDRTSAELAVAKAASYAAEVHNAQAYVAWMKEGIADSERNAQESAEKAAASAASSAASASGAAYRAGLAEGSASLAGSHAEAALACLEEMREYVTDATPEKHGLMSTADKSKLDGVEEGANNYAHPAYAAAAEGLYLVTVDGTGHVAAVRAVTKQDIVALGIPAQDTVYSLPAASAETLGGVKVGSGLAVDGDGTLRTDFEEYVLPVAKADTLGGVKVGDGLAIAEDGTLIVQRPAIRTVMDAEAVPGTLYTLGEQTSVALALPSSGEAGQEIGVIFYSGATPATLSVTGALPFNFAPTANSRVELNALHDGTSWQVLWAEQATEAASASAGTAEEAGA